MLNNVDNADTSI